MSQTADRTGRGHQHGAATLVMTVVLLSVLTLMQLFLARGLVFEQKASTNQLRATLAQEAAEAGLEWAVAMLNHPEGLSASCEADATGGLSFRARYAPLGQTFDAAAPGCVLSGAGMSCVCPAAGAQGPGGTTQTSFTVSMTPDPQDSGATVLIRAQGCAAPPQACTNNLADQADATAAASVAVTLRPMLRVAPTAAVTCGGTCALVGQAAVSNRSSATQGVLAHAGGTVTIGAGATLVSIPGSPAQAAVATHDSTLSAWAAADPDCALGSLFQAYFGIPLSAYASAPTVRRVDCSTQASCGRLVTEAYAGGWRAFHFPQGLTDDGSSGPLQWGTVNDPVLLVSQGPVHLADRADIHGLVYVSDAHPNAWQADQTQLRGALMACANLTLNGGNLSFDQNVIEATRRAGSLLVKVPGSWKDFE